MSGSPQEMMRRLRDKSQRNAEYAMTARVGAGVGGIFTWISSSDVDAFAKVEHNAFLALERDMHQQLVYDDPDVLRAAALKFRSLGAGSSDVEIQKAQNEIADILDANAVRLDNKIAESTPEQVKKDQSWSIGYRDFIERWNAFYTEHFVETGVALTLSSTLWDNITSFDHEFRTFYASFPGKPTRPLPETPEARLASLRASGGIGGVSIPWGKIAIGAAVLGGVYFLLTRRSPETVAVVQTSPSPG